MPLARWEEKHTFHPDKGEMQDHQLYGSGQRVINSVWWLYFVVSILFIQEGAKRSYIYRWFKTNALFRKILFPVYVFLVLWLKSLFTSSQQHLLVV